MKRWVIILLLLLSAPAGAELKLFPMWESKLCGDGRFACYDFDKAKSIIKIDLDLQLKLKELDACKKDLEDTNGIVLKLQGMMAADQNTIGTLQLRLKEKTAAHDKAVEELKKMEGSSIWNYVPWIIAGTVVLMSGSFVLGWYLSSD